MPLPAPRTRPSKKAIDTESQTYTLEAVTVDESNLCADEYPQDSEGVVLHTSEDPKAIKTINAQSIILEDVLNMTLELFEAWATFRPPLTSQLRRVASWQVLSRRACQ